MQVVVDQDGAKRPVFAASTVAQVALARRLGRWALAAGCVGLIAGMGLLAVGLASKSLGIVIAAVIVAGLGQGLSFRAGLQAVNSQAPAERRASVASTFFIVMYIAISLPVIGDGVVANVLGLQTAGIAFSIAVAVIAAIALATLIPTSTPGRRLTAPVKA